MGFIFSNALRLHPLMGCVAAIAAIGSGLPQPAIAAEITPTPAAVPDSSDRLTSSSVPPDRRSTRDKSRAIPALPPQQPAVPALLATVPPQAPATVFTPIVEPNQPSAESPSSFPFRGNRTLQRPAGLGDLGSIKRSNNVCLNGCIPGSQAPPSRAIRDDLPHVSPVPPLMSQRPAADPTSAPPSTPDSPTDPTNPPTDPANQDDAAADPELGVLQLRELELQLQRSPQPPSVFFSAGVSYFHSDNILLDEIDPLDDQLIGARVQLSAAPRLNARTILLASIEGSLIRYGDLSDLDYNELEFRAGIRHFLSRRMYGELSLSNQQLFEADGGDRFLNDHSIRFTLARRDPILPRLNLNSFYQLRLSFADPSDRSRILNTVGVSLTYDLLNNMQTGLSYQFLLADFTEQDRQDTYQQLIAQLSYTLNRTTRISLYGGFSFGHSTDSDIDFDSSIFGASIDINLSLF